MHTCSLFLCPFPLSYVEFSFKHNDIIILLAEKRTMTTFTQHFEGKLIHLIILPQPQVRVFFLFFSHLS